jgi:hypothetical protein
MWNLTGGVVLRKVKLVGLICFTATACGVLVTSAASATTFTAASYPVALEGSTPVLTPHTWKLGGFLWECDTTFEGTANSASEEL